MITADIANQIRRQVGEKIAVEHSEANRFDVSTPFMFADGDHYGFALLRDEATGRWRLTDDGEVVSKAGYLGIDLLAPGRVEMLRKTAEFYGLNEQDGELSLSVDGGDFGRAFFRFSQACLDINRLAKMPAQRRGATPAKHDLRNKLESVVKAALPSISYVKGWHHPTLDPHGIYGVDIQIESRIPVLLFAAETNGECLHATIAYQRYRQLEMPFNGVAVIDDAQGVSERNVLALEDAIKVRFRSDEQDELAEYLLQKAS